MRTVTFIPTFTGVTDLTAAKQRNTDVNVRIDDTQGNTIWMILRRKDTQLKPLLLREKSPRQKKV